MHKLFALDTVLPDLGQPTKARLTQAMQGHVLGQAELVGTYQQPAMPPAGERAIVSAGGSATLGSLAIAADGSYASRVFRSASLGGGHFVHSGKLQPATPPATLLADASIAHDPGGYVFWGMVTVEQPVYSGGSRADFYLAYHPATSTALLMRERAPGAGQVEIFWLM